MNKSLKILFMLLLTSYVAIGCGDDDKDEAAAATSRAMPDFAVNCLASHAGNCVASTDGKTVLMAIYKSGFTCANNPEDANFYASTNAHTATCNATGCTATVSNFFEPSSTSAVTTISNSFTTASVISFIDVDGNGEPSSGDPSICSDDVDISTATVNIDGAGWANTP